jgi:translation initiation factor 6 (eIF-6)
MAPDEQAILATFRVMSDALEMVEDALAVARQGVNANPTKQERRQLDEDILELALKRSRLTNSLIALGRGQGTVRPPTAGQVAQIKELATEVDRLTRESIAASGAVVAAGNVLDLLAESGLA